MFVKNNLKYFEEIYVATYDDVFKYTILRCSNINDVNDIIQEVYMELHKILSRKKLIDLKNPSAFLIEITKNKLKSIIQLKSGLKVFHYFRAMMALSFKTLLCLILI